MTTHFSTKWKPAKAEKELSTVSKLLLPGEEVWYLGPSATMRPLTNYIALTQVRLVGLTTAGISFQASYADIDSIATDGKKSTVEVVQGGSRSMVFKAVPDSDHGAIEHCFAFGKSNPAPAHLVQQVNEALAAEAATQVRATAARELSWPDAIIKGKLARAASEAILRQCHPGESPWLILTSSGGAGCLVAWDDRLAIIKTGGLTSLMAGSLGGERSATFHFSDVTGIEYNSGFVNGVLEILTPSYSGTANRDFWRGSGQSRNANSNDPWTLSNCLPLAKIEHKQFLGEINELKLRISQSKQPRFATHQPLPQSPPAPEPSKGPDLVEQLAQLATLHGAGALTDAEYSAAKARLLA